MDNAQVEQELEDLEARLERLRSLYEQYFMGLEKLEPQVLRKDVDRKLWILRREQIRNTALRFKFQTIIQRYNTYQQYWTRVVREIENGTYRRDIMKVAQRFGEKEALTILGRKRAEQYKRLAVNQAERRARNKARGEEETNTGPDISISEEEAPLSIDPEALERMEAGIEAVERPIHESEPPFPAIYESEPPPPAIYESEPPPRAMPAVAANAEPAARAEPGEEPDDMESMLMLATVGVKTWGERPKAPPARPKSAPPAAPPVAAPEPEEAPTTPEPQNAPVPAKPAVSQPAAAPPGKNRVAELAAQMRAKKEAAKPAMAPTLDELLNSAPKPALAFKPAAATVKPEPVAAKPAPAIVKPAPAIKPAPATAAPLPKPAPQPAPAPAQGDALSEQKMREIYAKYVGAKRAANESTAGITYDKLAASLKAQADKLRSSHPTRSIDFEVVTKDGKTALRPVVK